MPIDLPMFTTPAQRIARSRLVPPFITPQYVSPQDEEFENAVYSLSAVFFKTNTENLYESILLETTVSEAVNPVKRTFDSDGIAENEFKTLDDLARWCSDILSQPDLPEWDLTKCEIWIVHNAETRRKVEELTANMLAVSGITLYPDTDYRGSCLVKVGAQPIPIPVHLWLDYGHPGMGVFIDNTDLRQFGPNVPEGHVPYYQKIMDDVSDEEYETRVWNAFAEMLNTKGLTVSNAVHEPNGNNFPDWRAEIDGHECDIEVTRLMKGMLGRRLLVAQRKPLSSAGDRRLDDVIANARFSEEEIHRSISESLADKSGKPAQTGSTNPYILIIVNDFFTPMEARFRIWKNHDYSAFDAVFLANYNVDTEKFEFQPVAASRRRSDSTRD